MAGDAMLAVRVRYTRRLLATQVRKAVSLKDCMVGLLNRNTLLPGEGLIIQSPAPSIHTFGMRFAIDLIFFDRSYKVLALREDVRPGRLLAPIWMASGVLEVAAGTIRQVGVRLGECLEVFPVHQP